MRAKENVINFALRKGKNADGVEGKKTTNDTPAAIVDMTERREAILQQERRRVRRTILSEFIGVHVVVPNHGLMAVTLFDIGDGGLSFDVQGKAGRFRTGEMVAMRVYLNHQTYFPFVVKVTNVRELSDEGLYRHGANFQSGEVNETALHHFVKFIESVSASLQTDSGDVMVSNLFSKR